MSVELMYRIYTKYSETLTPYNTCVKILTGPFCHLLICLKCARCVANSADPDQTPQNAASDQSLPCLLRPVYPNT